MPLAPAAVTVRAARPDDIPNLIELVREHAAYERAAPPSDGVAERLSDLLFAPAPRLHAIIAEVNGVPVGYATASLEVETWQAREFLHMDCLFLREGARGSGVGGMLLGAVRQLAIDLGVDEVQWQTPDWNEGAVRFYDRTGAVKRAKYRYSLAVDLENVPSA
jgi:GNAT superfamily N-acetyltransferase